MSATGSSQKRYGGSIRVTSKQTDPPANGIPSAFSNVLKSPIGTSKPSSSSTLKSSQHSKGSIHSKNSTHRDRPKINILALVDDAIEDGATEEAKEKAATEKAMATAPVLPKKKVIKVIKKQPAKTAVVQDENADLEPEVGNSVDENPAKTPVAEPPKPRSARIISTVEKAVESENTSSGVPSLFGSTVKASNNGAAPAWKARVKAQGKKLPDSPQTEAEKQPTPLPPKSSSLRSSNYKPSTQSLAPASPTPQDKPSSSKDFKRVSPAGKSSSSPTKASPRPSPKQSPKPSLRHFGKNSVSNRSPLVPPKSPLPSAPPLVKSPPVAAAVSDDEISISDADSDTPSVGEPVITSPPLQTPKKVPSPASPSKGSKKALTSADDTDDDDTDDGAYSSPKKKLSGKASNGAASPRPLTSRSTASPRAAKATSISSPSGRAADMADAMRLSRVGEKARGDRAVERLQKELEEVTSKVENAASNAEQELADLKKEHEMEKQALRVTFMKDIQAHKKVTEKQDKEHQKMVDQEQQAIEELRAANQKLRATLEKLPRQMAELAASNQSLEKANEEIAGHFDELLKFSKKLQTDQDRLQESSAKCKNEFLPRYRQELWERQQFLNAETKIKNLYRDCMIKIANKIERTSQVDLIEEIATMVLETEGEINPEFDPKLLFAQGGKNSNDDSDSDENNKSDSDSDSDSESD
jgi:hypothetical protein